MFTENIQHRIAEFEPLPRTNYCGAPHASQRVITVSRAVQNIDFSIHMFSRLHSW